MPQDRTTGNKDKKVGWATKAAQFVREIDTRDINDEETRRGGKRGTDAMLRKLGMKLENGKLVRSDDAGPGIL